MTIANQASRMGRRPKWPMSAYMASPPVTDRNAAPSTAKVTAGGAWTRNSAARSGSRAPSTAGARRMPPRPSTAKAANHTTITGPKMPPMNPVPRFWITKRPTSTTSVIGTTNGVRTGASSFSPSTADSTEMAGVMAPSP